ncbi:membrane protein insertase YidC [Enterobacteriaceae endosymbiont of Donacia cincticornis]|uniref:membrane protein insertase YidC n=1 Tax=Enterobacteriaceae endosymbiont of Donacia cincticornis TaxID=2675773 RepID=UPI0014497310|nr:membrane protein insertase YidC [Enterobacteriaceae endosymbiont of Donacia cincticornis]QJC36286.1 membrane protein insertase YidC [Enterobacteriaceae endosymbiont of Donacia cincticornis]
MNSKNNIFLIIFCLFCFVILNNWQTIFSYTKNNIIKNIINSNHINLKKQSRKNFKNIKKDNILIKTDKFFISINLYGGTIEKVQLLDYFEKLHSKKFFTLLRKNTDFIYQIKSGVIKNDKFKKNINFYKNSKFFTNSNFFTFKKNQNILKIPFFFIKNNILYVKTFILKKGSYLIKIHHQIFNLDNKPISIGIFGQIDKSSITPQKYLDKKHNNVTMKTFDGVAFSTKNTKFKKYKFPYILKKKNIQFKTYNGWIAMLQQYFTSVWIFPHFNQENTVYIKKIFTNIISIGFKSPFYLILPGQKHNFTSQLWIGPKIQKTMSTIAPFLDLTIDYGFLGFLSKLLFKLLNFIFSIVKNWGISIIIITIIIRILTYPLSKQQYITVTKMSDLQPEIQKIKEKFSNNKERLNKEIISLYKRENLNPFAGFFPFIIQMPIFLALYYMLISSIELRHAKFIFWIQDLSSEDPYYILPIIMSITMLVIQYFSQNKYESNNFIKNKFTYIIPIVFSFFFLWLPSGLVLYYIINNLITILQQKWIIYQINNQNYKIL